MDGATERLSRNKSPEDSPRPEMCFCLHSNTPTAAATRGTRSNKAEREGCRDEEVTLSATEGGEVRRQKHKCSCKTQRRVTGCPGTNLFAFHSAVLVKRQKPLCFSLVMWTLYSCGFPREHVSCICIILLSVRDNDCCGIW